MSALNSPSSSPPTFSNHIDLVDPVDRVFHLTPTTATVKVTFEDNPPTEIDLQSLNLPEVKDYLSSTTLIPPALFVEPYESSLFDPSVEAQTLDTIFSSILQRTTTTTTIPSTSMEQPEVASESPSLFNTTTTIIVTSSPEVATTGAKPPEPSTLPALISPQYSKRVKVKSKQRQQSDFSKLIKILDMSSFDLRNNRPVNGQPSGPQISFPIRQLLSDGLSTHYWAKKENKAVVDDYSVASSDNHYHKVSFPGVDYRNSITGEEPDPDQASLLSIPVLVPISLSPNDYRHQLSNSVLKPIVIPLREKGKLIPAYVLHFTKPRHRIFKRNVLKEKKLLPLPPIKSNLLASFIPTLIKSIKSKSTKSSQSKANLPPHLLLPPPPPLIPGLPPLYQNELYFKHLATQLKSGKDLKNFPPLPKFYYQPVHYFLPPISVKNLKELNTALKSRNQTPKPKEQAKSGSMAVSGSSDSKLVVKPPYPLLDYYTVNRYLNQVNNIGTSAFNANYYPPPLFYLPTPAAFNRSKVASLRKTPPIWSSLVRKAKGKSLINGTEMTERKVTASTNVTTSTMPANIYVVDEVLDDFETGNKASGGGGGESDHKPAQDSGTINGSQVGGDMLTQESSIRLSATDSSSNRYSQSDVVRYRGEVEDKSSGTNRPSSSTSQQSTTTTTPPAPTTRVTFSLADGLKPDRLHYRYNLTTTATTTANTGYLDHWNHKNRYANRS